MIAPTTFTDKLARYDRKLRCRWAPRCKLWFIERRMDRLNPQYLGEQPNPYKSPRGLDLFDGWREGYLNVMAVHPTLLDDRVFDTLAQADAWRVGGFNEINRQLDAEQERWERQTDRQAQNFCEEASKEAYDRLAWLQGNRFATPFAEEPEPKLIETQRVGYKVRLRRVGDQILDH